MKNKNKYRVLGVICVAFFIIVITYQLFTDATIIYRIHQTRIQQAVDDILKSGSTDGIRILGVNTIDYIDGEHPIIEFTTSSFGIVPSGMYQGFYYSVDGSPVSFQNSNQLLEYNGEFWEWESRHGYKGETKNMEGKWFLFKAIF